MRSTMCSNRYDIFISNGFCAEQSNRYDFQYTRFMFWKWYTKFYNVLLVVIAVARITMMKKHGPNKNNRKYGLVFAKHNMIGRIDSMVVILYSNKSGYCCVYIFIG